MNVSLMEQMISQQLRSCDVLDDHTLAAIRRVPREQFVPGAWRSMAYADVGAPLPLGKRMWSPTLAGRVLQALAPQAGAEVLEIGTGSGYVSACCAALGAHVRSLELHAEIAALARRNLQAAGVSSVEVLQADGLQLADEQRFDCVYLTASLPLWLPRCQQALKVGGRLFVVVGEGPVMQARLIARRSAEEFHSSVLFETSLEAMDNATGTPAFRF
jgi:protein-L-isoaspartate(D-aspartate) O-methyltransferase